MKDINYESTPDELRESNRKCWHGGCQKTGWLEVWTGYNYCFEHWKLDYKYGSGGGLWRAIKWTKFNFKKLFKSK